MKLFYKNNGAISVFLSLILLPVLIVSFLAVDGARIYVSKAIVSDAGEMAMNAALAQYNYDLKDEYGLIAMDKEPSAMKGELEKFYNASLTGTGVDGSAESYDHLLQLVNEEFSVINLEASKLYKNEVEKQQIVEYMKYRAPVCMTEMVLEKVNILKDAGKMMDAMKSENDFVKKSEECHDGFESVKTALDNLDKALVNIKEKKREREDILKVLDDVKKEFTDTERSVAAALAIRYGISAAAADPGDTNFNEITFDELQDKVKQYINLVNAVPDGEEDGLITDYNYSKMKAAKILHSEFDRLLSFHGNSMDYLLTLYDEEHEQTVTPTPSPSPSVSPSPSTSPTPEPESEERREVRELIAEYNNLRKQVEDYKKNVYNMANKKVEENSLKLKGIIDDLSEIVNTAQTAVTELENLKIKLEEAKEKYDIWKGDYDQIPGSVNHEELNGESSSESSSESNSETEANNSMVDKTGMAADLEEYGKLFEDDGSGLDGLVEIIKGDQAYINETIEFIKKEKCCSKVIATDDVTRQKLDYKTKMDNIMPTKNNLTDAVNDFKNYYEHVSEMSPSNEEFQQITDNEFYDKVKKMVEQEEKKNKQKIKEENQKLEQQQKDAEKALDTTGYPEFDWGNAEKELPSGAFAEDNEDVNNVETGGIDNKSDRNNMIDNNQESAEAAVGFLDKLDEAITSGIENLYVAEYGLQLFSYYTCDKKVTYESGKQKVETLDADKVIGLSGYKMSTHPAYKGEVEYMLWGNKSSAQNVKNTMGMIFAVRLFFNTFFALTNAKLRATAHSTASLICGAAPYLEPIVSVALRIGMAVAETVSDMSKIKEGYGVTIIKNEETWVSAGPILKGRHDNTQGVTLNYSEFLRIFLYVKLFAGGLNDAMGHIADCVQVNTVEDIDITKMYTMVAVKSKVRTNTTFLQQIADFSDADWDKGNTYSFTYESILGY